MNKSSGLWKMLSWLSLVGALVFIVLGDLYLTLGCFIGALFSRIVALEHEIDEVKAWKAGDLDEYAD